jgi:hypothetical protein
MSLRGHKPEAIFARIGDCFGRKRIALAMTKENVKISWGFYDRLFLIVA